MCMRGLLPNQLFFERSSTASCAAVTRTATLARSAMLRELVHGVLRRRHAHAEVLVLDEDGVRDLRRARGESQIKLIEPHR